MEKSEEEEVEKKKSEGGRGSEGGRERERERRGGESARSRCKSAWNSRKRALSPALSPPSPGPFAAFSCPFSAFSWPLSPAFSRPFFCRAPL